MGYTGDTRAPAPAVASFTLPGQLPELGRHNDDAAGDRGRRVDAAVVVVALMVALAMSSLLLIAIYYLHMLRKTSRGKLWKRTPAFSIDHPHINETHFQRSAAALTCQRMLPAHAYSSSSSRSPRPAGAAQVFTYKQLQSATSNFSPSNLIATAQDSRIYRGVLPNGRLSAIKQLHHDCSSKQVEHEFRMEVDLLSRLHSPYLLDLIGYCADLHHRLLVYEDMPNGSLQDQLHGHCSSSLDWSMRMRIALDAARGLEYLHEFVSPPIIHRDFRSSIVVLGENLCAKISDFGLAKIGSDNINGLVFTRVLGTEGYVAPEYAQTGHLTTKSDVYSFGIVLLELITGRTPVDMERPPGQAVLAAWALPQLTDRDKVHEMVDPLLQAHFSSDDLIQVAEIAAMCVQPEADSRPSMTDVVQSLVPLFKQRN